MGLLPVKLWLLVVLSMGLGQFSVSSLFSANYRVLLSGPVELQADWSSDDETFSIWVEHDDNSYPLEEVIFYIGEANQVTLNNATADYWGLEENDVIFEIPDRDFPNNSSNPNEVKGFFLSRSGNLNNLLSSSNVEWLLLNDSLQLPSEAEFLLGNGGVQWDTRQSSPGVFQEDGSGNDLYWAFTESGFYRLPVQLSAEIGGVSQESDPFYLHFYVDIPDVAPWQRWAIYSLGPVPDSELQALDPLETQFGLGVPNLKAYGLGIPLNTGLVGDYLPRPVMVEENGEVYLGLRFRTPVGDDFATREDLEVLIEGSSDLKDWDELVEGESEDFILSDAGEDFDGVPLKIARLVEPLSNSHIRFLRLRLNLSVDEIE